MGTYYLVWDRSPFQKRWAGRLNRRNLQKGCPKFDVLSGIVEMVERAHSLEDPLCSLFTNVIHKTSGHKEVLLVTNFDSQSIFPMVSVADAAFKSKSFKISCAFINQFTQNNQSKSSSTLLNEGYS